MSLKRKNVMIACLVVTAGLQIQGLPAAIATDAAAPDANPAPPAAVIYCQRCHGVDGMSPNTLWPNLAGQNAAYMRQQLAAFRAGHREDPFMQSWSRVATAAEIETIVQYYSALPSRSREAVASASPQQATTSVAFQHVAIPSATTATHAADADAAVDSREPPPGHVVPGWYLGMPVVVRGRTRHPPGSLNEAAALAQPGQKMRVYIVAPVAESIGASPEQRVPLGGRLVTLPEHQATFTCLGNEDSPIAGIGYFVTRASGAAETEVRSQPLPAKAWPSAPLAAALRIGGEWMPLSSHVTIEYGLARGLLELEYFDAGDDMWAAPDWNDFALPPGNATAGRAKANNCTGCHGLDGMSANDLWPHLAGQQPGYTARQLRAYREGWRRDPIMMTFARSLSDEDIADLAAWYHSLDGKQQ